VELDLRSMALTFACCVQGESELCIGEGAEVRYRNVEVISKV